MTSSTNWNDVVNKLKGVTIGTRSVSQSKTKDYWTSGNNTFLTRIDVDATAVYNNGRSQGRTDVKNSPGSYGLYTKSQYDSNYNNGYNNGRKVKYKKLTLKSSSGTYGFKKYWSNSTVNVYKNYVEYYWNETHQIHSAWVWDTGYHEWMILCANGRIFQSNNDFQAALDLTHSTWNTGGYFPFPVSYSNTNYNVEVWYT